MNYSDKPEMCRVDFWRESGKWYTTEAVEWIGNGFAEDAPRIHEQFEASLREHFGNNPRLVGMRATCLEPYHKYEHPISLMVKDWTKT